jgi:hypothetical protein
VDVIKVVDVENTHQKKYQDIGQQYFDTLKHRCTQRIKKEFSITIEYIWNLLIEQNYKCAITGEQLIPPNKDNYGKINTASLDRIDSSKGYIKGNVQWIHKIINYMKSNYSQQDFIEWCRRVVKHNENSLDR